MTVRRANNAVQAPLLIVTMTRRRSCCFDLDSSEDVKICMILLIVSKVFILPELRPPVLQEQVYNCSSNEDIVRSGTAPDRQGKCLCFNARGINSEKPLVYIAIIGKRGPTN